MQERYDSHDQVNAYVLLGIFRGDVNFSPPRKNSLGFLFRSSPDFVGGHHGRSTKRRPTQNSQKNIISIEDPVEYIFQPKKSLIEHREVGIDAPSFQEALRAAFRQDADVMMVGEMRAYETISAAVTAAETGH